MEKAKGSTSVLIPGNDSNKDEKHRHRAHYEPPWANTSIIGVAGSSGSGKTSLALAIIEQLSLPWVVLLSMDSFYKELTPEQSKKAFENNYDFDAPNAIDFDLLVEKLKEIKLGQRTELPIYSFEKHARLLETTTIYSPHVLILEGILALHDLRVLDILDLKIFAEADADLCLSRRLRRDVKDRGRDIEGCIKQWFAYVKPNFRLYVGPQRGISDIIVPRSTDNLVAIDMVVDRIKKILNEKSEAHSQQLLKLGQALDETPLTDNVVILEQRPQIVGIHTKLLTPSLSREDFIFNFDRLAVLLIERGVSYVPFRLTTVMTPLLVPYKGLKPKGETPAVVLSRGGSIFETALHRVIPDARTDQVLVQTNYRTGEPELHYCNLSPELANHASILLLDAQMSSGGAALMAVRVLIDHGVEVGKIVFIAYTAGRKGVARLVAVFPEIRIVVGRLVDDFEDRWVEQRYLGC